MARFSDKINYTIFPSRAALTKSEWFVDSIDELAGMIRSKTGSSKLALPWIKLARFSGIPNPHAANSEYPSLRYDLAMVEIFGVEGDYDAGRMTIDEAAGLLSGIECLLYTTPSSTPEKPRWRVLAPTSRPYPPDERARFLARINGRLGGELAGESFTRCQAYVFGQVEGAAPITVIVNHGFRVDQFEGAPELYKNGSTTPPAPKVKEAAPPGLVEDDDHPVLLVEGWRRVQWHIAHHGIGVDPRGGRAHSLAIWLGDMRSSSGAILSVERVIEMMQLGGYGEVSDRILERCDRGCELVLSLLEKYEQGLKR
jgi:hypothetical protein